MNNAYLRGYYQGYLQKQANKYSISGTRGTVKNALSAPVNKNTPRTTFARKPPPLTGQQQRPAGTPQQQPTRPTRPAQPGGTGAGNAATPATPATPQQPAQKKWIKMPNGVSVLRGSKEHKNMQSNKTRTDMRNATEFKGGASNRNTQGGKYQPYNQVGGRSTHTPLKGRWQGRR